MERKWNRWKKIQGGEGELYGKYDVSDVCSWFHQEAPGQRQGGKVSDANYVGYFSGFENIVATEAV